jgi:RNA recognition motif-containing protein
VGKKLYVGNLPFSTTEAVLTEVFGQCGTVTSAKIIMDRESGRSKGFGFVEMSSDAEAAAAIEKFNGADFDGRAMTVNEAKPMAPREGGGGGFGGGGGGGRGGRGGFGGGGGGGRGGRF